MNNNGVNKDSSRQNTNNDALSPLVFGIRIAGALTHQSLGPSTGIIIPVFRNNIPAAFLLVVILDFLAALAVKRSMIAGAQMPNPFEALWCNPQSPSDFTAKPKSRSNTPINGRSVDPSIYPSFSQGISLSLIVDAPLKSRYQESSAVFSFLFMEWPKIPALILPVVSLIIYTVSQCQWKNMCGD